MTLASRRSSIDWTRSQSGDKNPNFTGGRYVDDKGYIRVLMPDHPHQNAGYVYEHRLVAEAVIGRYLQPGETIHHINEIKIDNRWENFYLTTPSEHSAIHREGKKQKKERRDKMREGAKRRAKSGQRGSGGRFVKAAEKPATLDGDVEGS